MSVKPNAFTMAQSALYNHSLAFSQYWGDAAQADEGTVQFSRLPDELANLRIRPDFRKRWMGGTCAMNIVFSHPIAEQCHGRIEFKGSRGGVFTGKANGEECAQLLSTLDADDMLKKTLLSVDLDSLVFDIKDGMVQCTLTPYGGGMAYMVIPPVRTAIPLPPEQILPLAEALKTIGSHIQKI
ncbi:DUF3156 family protein [Vibrio sp. WJH972]